MKKQYGTSSSSSAFVHFTTWQQHIAVRRVCLTSQPFAVPITAAALLRCSFICMVLARAAGTAVNPALRAAQLAADTQHEVGANTTQHYETTPAALKKL
jgi:hypothetical protein